MRHVIYFRGLIHNGHFTFGEGVVKTYIITEKPWLQVAPKNGALASSLKTLVPNRKLLGTPGAGKLFPV